MESVEKIAISFIIVHYHATGVLFDCIKSIVASVKTSYEIIVVDNDETKTLAKPLKKIAPFVRYLQSPGNIGFGAGSNLGAKKATGQYLVFLNPDTRLTPHAIDALYRFMSKHQNAGIVSALLVNEDQQVPVPQGAGVLTPLTAICTFSFIHKLFPTNLIAKSFWQYTWGDNKPQRVASVPLGAAMIKRDLFASVNGFDEKFFLYYEDYDLCKRVLDAGYQNYLYPQAKVIHLGGKGGTHMVTNLSDIFRKSRFYYFKKHFGIFQALITTFILSTGKGAALFWGVLMVTTLLFFYRLPELMPFIGDQAWFYLSARDMLQTGTIPLVGIASSHPWIHQGAFWTYLLAPALWLSHFNPLSGAIISFLFHLGTIILLYRLGCKAFSQKVGLLAAVIYATSPLVLMQARMPYHTSPIPFVTIVLLYAMYQWVMGKMNYFPLILLTLAVLYNLELATFVLTVGFISVFAFGLWKKKQYVRHLFSKKIALLSFGAFIIPMVPMFLYDLGHGFPQTLKFIAWIGYKVLIVFGYPQLHPEITSSSFTEVINFLAVQYSRFIFPANAFIASILACGSFGLLGAMIYYHYKKKASAPGLFLVSFFFIVSLLGIIATKTTSDAYLPIMFPLVALLTAVFFDKIMQKQHRLVVLLISLVIGGNIAMFIGMHAFVQPNKMYGAKLAIAKQIIIAAQGNQYTIVGKGEGSKFESFIMPYSYLTWMLGHAPSVKKEKLQFIITETEHDIKLQKRE